MDGEQPGKHLVQKTREIVNHITRILGLQVRGILPMNKVCTLLIYMDDCSLNFPFPSKCTLWNLQEGNGHFFFYAGFLHKLWRNVLIIASRVVLNTPLGACVCKVYTQEKKNQDAKVNFRKLNSRTIILSVCTPEIYLVPLLKRKNETDQEMGPETRVWLKILGNRLSW